MLILYLIEFVLGAVIVLALLWAVQQMMARARAQAQAQQLMQELLQLDEARCVVLQHVHREMARGVAYEQAALAVLSDSYVPGLSAPETLTTVSAKQAEQKTVR